MGIVIEAGLPALIILAMTIVGLELTPTDLNRVLHYPAEVAASLLGQVLALPLIAAALVVWLRPEPAVAGGLILAAAAPQATSSNYFCLLARANIALSVTLTVASSVLALASTPLVAKLGFGLLLDQQAGFVLPVEKVMQQVLTGLLLPVGAGMLVRHYAPGFVQRNHERLQRLSRVAVVAMLAIILIDQAATIAHNLGSIVLAAVLFTVAAAALGFGIARAFAWPRADAITVLAGFPSRSLSIAALISINVLGRADFLAFAAPFFVVQALLLVPVMLLARPAGGEAVKGEGVKGEG
jgi:BASS family bile acid:Na+ symporter